MFSSQKIQIFGKTSKFMMLTFTLLNIKNYIFHCFFRILVTIQKKLDQIVAPIMPNISNLFLFLLWRLEINSRVYMILIN